MFVVSEKKNQESELRICKQVKANPKKKEHVIFVSGWKLGSDCRTMEPDPDHNGRICDLSWAVTVVECAEVIRFLHFQGLVLATLPDGFKVPGCQLPLMHRLVNNALAFLG